MSTLIRKKYLARLQAKLALGHAGAAWTCAGTPRWSASRERQEPKGGCRHGGDVVLAKIGWSSGRRTRPAAAHGAAAQASRARRAKVGIIGRAFFVRPVVLGHPNA